MQTFKWQANHSTDILLSHIFSLLFIGCDWCWAPYFGFVFLCHWSISLSDTSWGGGGGVLFFAAAHRVIAQLVPPPPPPLPCLGYKKTFLKTGIFPHKMTLCCFMLKKQQPPFPVVLCMLLCYTCVLYGGCWKKSHTDMEGLFSSVELDLELL